MLINLRNDWYAPNGKLYRKVSNPVTVPEKYRKQMPSTAIEVKAKDPDDEDELEDFVPVDPSRVKPPGPSVEDEEEGDKSPLPGQVASKRK